MDRMDPYRFISYIELFGVITSTWPPHPEATTLTLVVINLMWTSVVVSYICSFAFVLVTIELLDDDPVALSKFISINAIIVDACLQLIFARIQWPRLQILMQEIMSFLKTAKRNERDICRKYIKRYLSYHIVLYVSWIAAIGSFFVGPLLLKKQFPVDVWVPFSVEPTFNRFVVYCFQYFTILQTMSVVTGDSMVFLLLAYSTVRLELLGMEFRRIEDEFHLRNCVRRHKEIIRFFKETECAIRLLVVKNLFAVSITIVCAGLQISNDRSLTVHSQFFLIICVECVRLFGFTWVGDDLAEMSASLASSIYRSPAIVKSFFLGKNLLIAMQRSQRTLVITMWGTRLGLSLEFFAKYTLRVMSFFMTLRAIVDRYV